MVVGKLGCLLKVLDEAKPHRSHSGRVVAEEISEVVEKFRTTLEEQDHERYCTFFELGNYVSVSFFAEGSKG